MFGFWIFDGPTPFILASFFIVLLLSIVSNKQRAVPVKQAAPRPRRLSRSRSPPPQRPIKQRRPTSRINMARHPHQQYFTDSHFDGPIKILHALSSVDCIAHQLKFQIEGFPVNISDEERLQLVEDECGRKLEEHFKQTVGDRATFKSAKRSDMLRKSGNAMLSNDKQMEAHKLYTQAVAVAPSGSAELAVAFANRSAVLRSMGRLEDCIDDINRAIAAGYSQTLRQKLLLRMALCWRDLGDDAMAKEAFEKTIAFVNKSTHMSDPQKADFLKQTEKEKNAPRVTHEEQDLVLCALAPLPCDGPNPKIKSASAALEIKRDGVNGRHFIAKRDIDIGEILIVDPLYAVTLDAKYRYEHCTHCQTMSYVLLPCQTCIWALFCSAKCKAEAAVYHQYECEVMSRIGLMEPDLEDDVFAMCVRLIAKSGGPEALQRYLDEEKKQGFDVDRLPGFDSSGCFIANSLHALINLKSHLKHKRAQSIFQACFTTLQMIKCYKVSGFSISKQVAGLILKLRDISNSNYTQEVRIFCWDENVGQCINIEKIGHSVSTTCGMLPHSCNPNSACYDAGRNTIVYASEPIKKGSVVTCCYGAMYHTICKDHRQDHLLAQSFIQCKCEACDGFWPLQCDMQRTLTTQESNLLINPTDYRRSSKEEFSKAFIKHSEDFIRLMYHRRKRVHHQYCLYKDILSQCYAKKGNRIYVRGKNRAKYLNTSEIFI